MRLPDCRCKDCIKCEERLTTVRQFPTKVATYYIRRMVSKYAATHGRIPSTLDYTNYNYRKIATSRRKKAAE